MKETFEKYREYLIQETMEKIKNESVESTYKGQKTKGWRKDWIDSDEYKNILSGIYDKSRRLKKLRNANEESDFYKYFIENEEVLCYLLENNKKITNESIEEYFVEKAVKEANFDSLKAKYEKYKLSVFDRVTKYFTSEKIGFYEEEYDPDEDYSYNFYGYRNSYPKKVKRYLNDGTVETFVESYDICKFSYALLIGCSYCTSYFKKHFKSMVENIRPDYIDKPRGKNKFDYRIWIRFCKELNYHEVLT